MNFLFSVFFGAAIAVSATLIHQTLPPVGVALGIIATYLGIWYIGRRYGKRRYKFFALAAWLIVISRAGSFGAGNELLIQGDNPGSALLMIGFIAGVLALLRRP
jgi:Flp pilus assembly protein TadB